MRILGVLNISLVALLSLAACGGGSNGSSSGGLVTGGTNEIFSAGAEGVLHTAYLSFTGNVTVALDGNGGHTGPASFRYHLDPKAITDNDDELVGGMEDGLFLYGRLYR